MKMFVIKEGTEGFLIKPNGIVYDWRVRRDMELTGDDLAFDLVRFTNGQLREEDWGPLFGRVQRWCESRHMGFTVDGYTLVIKARSVMMIG